MSDPAIIAAVDDAIRVATSDAYIAEVRMNLAAFTSKTFQEVGTKLHVVGYLLGPDRQDGTSPFGHGNDAAVAVSLLLRIASQLVSGSADLLRDGRHYAGSALVRQLVEVEYLAWAFETKNEVAAQWLRSSREERHSMFTPAKLRKEADGRFRSVDYSYHCELGGHPVPDSWKLITADATTAQLMLADCLGHSGRIWDHVVRWATGYTLLDVVGSQAGEMLARYTEWKRVDPLTELPPPPATFSDHKA